MVYFTVSCLASYTGHSESMNDGLQV